MKYYFFCIIFLTFMFSACMDFSVSYKKNSGNTELDAMALTADGKYVSGVINSTDKKFYKFLIKQSGYKNNTFVSYLYSLNVKWISGDDFQIYARQKYNNSSLSYIGSAIANKENFYYGYNSNSNSQGFIIIEISDGNSSLTGQGVFEIGVLEETN